MPPVVSYLTELAYAAILLFAGLYAWFWLIGRMMLRGWIDDTAGFFLSLAPMLVGGTVWCILILFGY